MRSLVRRIFDFAKIDSKFSTNQTKQCTSQSIASIYDPSDLFSPLIVKIKVLPQYICISKVEWDTILDAPLCEMARDFIRARKSFIY